MALVGNGVRLSSSNPMLQSGAASAGAIGRQSGTTSGSSRNFWAGEATVIVGQSIANTAAFPNGYEAPAAWHLAPKGGGLSAYVTVTSEGLVSGPLTMARLMQAELTADGGVTEASLSLLVQLAASLEADHELTASASAVASLVAELVSDGDLDGALSLIAFCASEMVAAATLDADLRGTASMAATLSGAGDILTAAGVAAAVWAAQAAASNAAGTMGEKLNDAGSAANPWTEVIEAGFTAAEILRIVAASLAGSLSGAGTSTLTIKGVDGTTDRVVATVDPETGDRLAITLDGDA